jgi:MFS transporter, ACS family, hexuronate transporter
VSPPADVKSFLWLVLSHHVTLSRAAWYAWIPPVLAAVDGVAGGWLSLHFVEGGIAPASSRLRVCLAASLVALVTACLPLAPTPARASTGISLSIFAVSAFSVNMYSLPLDVFGGAGAVCACTVLFRAAPVRERP